MHCTHMHTHRERHSYRRPDIRTCTVHTCIHNTQIYNMHTCTHAHTQTRIRSTYTTHARMHTQRIYTRAHTQGDTHINTTGAYIHMSTCGGIIESRLVMACANETTLSSESQAENKNRELSSGAFASLVFTNGTCCKKRSIDLLLVVM